MDSNQNKEAGKPATDNIAANEQNILPADIPPPAPLENQSPLPETSPPQTQPPMEVHHHAHTPRKKWNHYLWEFLMLFLAVFCGFLAENQREHFIEHQRERQFMKSMTEDLARDTAMLTVTEGRAKTVSNNVDTILSIIQYQKFDDSSIRQLYRVNLSSLSFFGTSFTDRTTVQLKNSGAMRLIRKETVADGIIDYWNHAAALEAMNIQLEEYKMKARDQSYKIFYARYYRMTTMDEGTPKLMTTDMLLLSEYVNRLTHIKSILDNRYMPEVKRQQDEAKKLLALIKKEYKLQ